MSLRCPPFCHLGLNLWYGKINESAAMSSFVDGCEKECGYSIRGVGVSKPFSAAQKTSIHYSQWV